MKTYRKLIWKSLLSLSKMEKYRDKLRMIFSSYGKHIEDVSVPVLQYDLTYIKSIIEESYLPCELQNCLMVEKIVQVFERRDILCNTHFSEYFKKEEYSLYWLLRGPSIFAKEYDYKEREQRKKQAIEEHISICMTEGFHKIIDVCCDITGLDGRAGWEIGAGLGIAFEALYVKKDYYIDAIQYYLEKDTPCNLNPLRFVNMLFSYLDDVGVYSLINSFDYGAKNTWLYAYYHELPQKYIDKLALDNLYAFLSDSSDKNTISSQCRDVVFLEKYTVVDEGAFARGCGIILAKSAYSPFMVQIYLESLFYHFNKTSQELIAKFDGYLSLLNKIYITLLNYGNNHDYDGQFLTAIYLVQPSILDEYIDYLINKDKGSFIDDSKRNRFFFDLANFKEVFVEILGALIQGLQFPTISIPYYLESILLPCDGESELLQKQDEIISHCIQVFSSDVTKMRCLFEVVSKLTTEKSINYWLLFFEYNQSFEDFKMLPLTPMSCSWTGSAVPMYSAWIDFLESLIPHFTGLKWIQHKNHVETEIKYLKKRIELEQIDEILRG